MPRYFFSVVTANERYPDLEGENLDDKACARQQALAMARDLARSRMFTIRNWATCTLEITDGGGRLVHVVPLREVMTNR